MRRRCCSTVLAAVCTAGALTAGTGCEAHPGQFVAIAAGYLLGRVSGPPVVFVVQERFCYRNGEQVPCPAEEAP